MSRIRAERITNKLGTGAPLFPNGIRVVGLTSISNIAASTGTFTGNVSIGGTLTYEDVTNVDSVGVITARSGIVATGVVTATSFKGDGSLLTGITQTTINNNADNRIITGSGTANTLEGESNLTYDGSTLSLAGGADGTIQELRLAEGNASSKIATIKGFSSNTNEKGIQINTFHYTPKIPIKLASTGAIGLGGDNYGTAGQVLTTQGSGDVAQWASVSAVQVSDGFWNGSDVQNAYWSHQIWAQDHGSTPTQRTGFPSVAGQGMSLGGGEWTFPSAGLWKVEWNLQLSSGGNSTNDFYLEESTNSGSSWSGSGDDISGWNTHFCGNYSNDKSVANLLATINFSNATTYRLRCKLSTNGNAIVRKGTMILFTKLN